MRVAGLVTQERRFWCWSLITKTICISVQVPAKFWNSLILKARHTLMYKPTVSSMILLMSSEEVFEWEEIHDMMNPAEKWEDLKLVMRQNDQISWSPWTWCWILTIKIILSPETFHSFWASFWLIIWKHIFYQDDFTTMVHSINIFACLFLFISIKSKLLLGWIHINKKELLTLI